MLFLPPTWTLTAQSGHLSEEGERGQGPGEEQAVSSLLTASAQLGTGKKEATLTLNCLGHKDWLERHLTQHCCSQSEDVFREGTWPIGRGIEFGEMLHRDTRLPSDILAAAPVNPAKPGPSVNSSPFAICSPPGPAGLERKL